ncbi:MAG TPA: TolC family protein [Syntrophobacteraceae bacterium]|nr:TolC family protein [Syntrophobacteraceae bacterium]
MNWLQSRVGTLLVVVALGLGSPGVMAHAERVLTLNECLAMTLSYSRDVLKAEEHINISEGRYIEERAAALPQLKLEGNVLHGRDASYSIFNLPPDKNDYQSNLNLNQVVFTWGQVNSAIRAAKHDKAASAYLLEEARQLALRETATVFFTVLLAEELADVARENLKQKARHLDESQRKFHAGVAMEYDVLAAQVAMANAEPEVTRAENDVRLARDRLRYFLGIQEDFDIRGELVCALKPPVPLADVMETARQKRPEISYYTERLGVFKELVTVAKAGDKPRLELKGNVGYGHTDYEGVVAAGERWDAGLFLSFPVFDGFRTQGQVTQAKSRLRTVDIEFKKLLDDIALDARDATNRVREALDIVKALETTVAQARRLLEMGEAGYRYDVKTHLDVEDAELNVRTARSNLAKARREYLVARTKLLWVMGERLDALNLEETLGVGSHGAMSSEAPPASERALHQPGNTEERTARNGR